MLWVLISVMWSEGDEGDGWECIVIVCLSGLVWLWCQFGVVLLVFCFEVVFVWGFFVEQLVSVWELCYLVGDVLSVWQYGFDGFCWFVRVEVIDFFVFGWLFCLCVWIGLGFCFVDGMVFIWDENVVFWMQVMCLWCWFVFGVIWLIDMVQWGYVFMWLIDVLWGVEDLWVFSCGQVDLLCDLVGGNGFWVMVVFFGIDVDFFVVWFFFDWLCILSIGNDCDCDLQMLFCVFEFVYVQCFEVELIVQIFVSGVFDGVCVVDWMSYCELCELYVMVSVVVMVMRLNLYVLGMIVMFEVLVMGCLVVNIDILGMIQYVVEGEMGYLVFVGDVEVLVDCLVGFVDDCDCVEWMGVVGWVVVEVIFMMVYMCVYLVVIFLLEY